MLIITLNQLKEEYQRNYERFLSSNTEEILVIAPLKEIWKIDKEETKNKKSPET